MIGLNLTRADMGGTAHRLEDDKPSQYDQHSRVIECPSSVLHEIRDTVLERFNSLPHGGTEIFGVLFGTHDCADVRITGFRALITDHEFAHPGELSDEECAAFASAMPAGINEAGLSPVAAVGWFRSHPRSALTLGARDLEIANTLFSQPWQVTLVLRPGNSAMTRGRIFFRESAEPLAAGAGFQELTVDPAGTLSRQVSAVPAAELPPVADGSIEDPLPIQDAVPPTDALERADALQEPAAGNGSEEQAPATPSEALHLLTPRLASETPPEEPDVPNLNAAPGRTTTLRWPTALIVIAGLVAALYWFGRPQRLALRVFDNEGQLRISWDRNAKPVSQGRNAHLEINDGGAKAWVELDREQLHDGNVTYMRHSSNVTVRLVLPRTGAAPIEEVARFLGPAVERPAVTASAEEPQSGSASRVKSQPPVDFSPVPQRTAELVVAVPIERAAAREARPKFKAPSAVPRTAAASKPRVPDLTPPPVVARDNTSAAVPPMLRAQLAVEKLAPPPIPAASPLAPAPSAPASPRTVAPTAVQNPARPAPAAHPPALPASGRVIWIGRLQKNQTLIIKGKNCSTGTLVGELPSRPIKFSLSPGDLSSDGIVLYTSNSQYANNVVEPPGAGNGWNKTVYTWNPKFASDVAVEETPSAQNGWSGVLRGKNPKISVIVIDWALVN